MKQGTLTESVDTAAIKAIVLQQIGLTIDPAALTEDSDLYAQGLTSLATVGLIARA